MQMDKQATIYKFNTVTGKEELLAELPADIERIVVSGDTRYLYGLQADVDEAQNAVVRHWVVIDLQDKTLKSIDKNGVESSLESAAYSSATGRFYENELNVEVQTNNTKIYKIDGIGTDTPRFVKVSEVDDFYVLGPYAYQVVSTKKGVHGAPDFMDSRAPLRLYTESGEVTELAVAVGYINTGILLSLPAFPNLPAAETNDIVTGDFFKPANDVPEKIVTFLNAQVAGGEGCAKGEYMTYKVEKYDTDEQFSVLEAGCDSAGGLAFYKAEGDSYTQITLIQEGMSCEVRDKFGISTKVFPDCLQPGEEL